MKITSIVAVICFFASGCSYSQDCPENANKLPMYGRIKKCPEQIEADKIFLADCDKSYKTRKEAADHMIMRGWQYFYNKKLDTSMMRFNQAWLIDSLNADIYWGFGDLLGSQGKFKESIPFFERSLKLNPDNTKVWQDAATSYGNTFIQTKQPKYLNLSIDAIKKAIHLDPNNPALYSKLTSAYCYVIQKDSALKYLKITERLDSKAVNPEARRFLVNK